MNFNGVINPLDQNMGTGTAGLSYESIPGAEVFFALFGFIALALVLFQLWLFFRVFAKAGYNGWMSLLSLIPLVGPFICLLILAFDEWRCGRGGGRTPSSHR